MELEREIIQYLESNSKESTEEVVTFLLKLWRSSSLRSSSKYDVILRYFTKHLLLKIQEKSIEWDQILLLLKQRHPSNCVSSPTTHKILQSMISALNTNPTVSAISSCLELASIEHFKEYFKGHLDVYCKLLWAIIENFGTIQTDDEDTFNSFVTELYCFARLKDFKELFLKQFAVPLSRAAEKLPTSSKELIWNLIKTIFFSQLTSSGTSLDIFNRELDEDQRQVLMETFIFINKAKLQEITDFIKFLYENQLQEESAFLSRIRQVFRLLSQHEIELAPMKRLEPELFEQLSARINSSIEGSRHSMDFVELMETLSSLIKCDAFLFEKNIFTIVADCMLQEKTTSELTSYESFFKIVIRIFGKDLNQFLKKLLKSLGEKLESFILPTKRKRKSQGGSSVSKKKLKLSDASFDSTSDDCFSHIWTAALAEQFAEMVAGLNDTQSIKLWKQLNDFLAKELEKAKEFSDFDENLLFKIDFASNLLSELFVNTKLHEQMISQTEKVAPTVRDFNNIQSLFNDIILNFEYNNRVMNAFLKLSSSYESFLVLYINNSNPEVKSELSTFFVESALKANSEWKIIQQRVKNFGKIDEKNHLNSLLIQRQRNQSFSQADASKVEEFSLALHDEKQIEFLLRRPDTHSFFINSLSGKELKLFVQYCVQMDDKKLQSSVLCEIAKSQKLLDRFISDIDDETDTKTVLELLKQLPITCASEDNKKLIFGRILATPDVEEQAELIAFVLQKLLDNDSYKMFYKDFSMQQINEKFDDVKKYSRVYEACISNTSRKVSSSTLENFNWVLTSGNAELLQILARTVSEVPMAPVSGLTADALNKFKIDLVAAFLRSFDSKHPSICEAFMVLLRLLSENITKLGDETKSQFMALLQKHIKDSSNLPKTERVKLLLTTLKDAKKFSLNDELTRIVVDGLFAILKSTLRERMLSDSDIYLDVDLEKQLLSALKPFKNNHQISCVGILRQILIERRDSNSAKFLYCFKIYQAIFDGKAEEKSLNAIVKNYLKFYDDFVPKVLALDCADKISAISQIVETNNSLMKESKFSLENSSLDDFMSLLTDPLIKPPNDIEKFRRFYIAVGEALFVIANVRQTYFKSRVSQYFNVYRSLMEAVYFYKNDQEDELTELEVLLLPNLTLQLDNIMKLISKNHITSIKTVSLYIASSIVNIFVKNPKVLSVGEKLKLNIKNVCYQLLSTFDDKTRKHVYSVADETSREVYDGLFMEIRRRA